MSDDIKKYRAIISEGYQAAPASVTSDAVAQTAAKILESVGKRQVSSDELFGHIINNLPMHTESAAVDNSFIRAVLSEMKGRNQKDKLTENKMKKVSVNNLVPGQSYHIDGVLLKFVGTRNGSYEYPSPVKLGMARFGDRWVFHNSQGEEILYKKGYDLNQPPKQGLVPDTGDKQSQHLASIVA